MKKQLIPAVVALTLLVSGNAFAAEKDPVLLTVDGHDVKVSEFEYLYNKNNNQQLERQSLDDYLKLFIDYKLKVADAEHAGLQSTPAFKQEFNKFKNELSGPYLKDKETEDRLVNEAYSHHLKDVLVSHIMVMNDDESKALLDSVSAEIKAGRLKYEDAAERFSVDRSSAERGGLMGYVVPGRFPWAFEKAAYDTPQGELSEVINSGQGYHLIRVEKVTPSAGEVLASHILLLTRDMTPEQEEAVKTRMDSIYEVAISGADFGDLARRLSQDPGSGRQGGRLPWFGKGKMVAEFDSTAFAMPVGSISRPFKTSYGYHIINKLSHRSTAPVDEMRTELIESMRRDERSTLPRRVYIDKALDRFHADIDREAVERVCAVIMSADSVTPELFSRIAAMNEIVATADGVTITSADVVDILPTTDFPTTEIADGAFRANTDEALMNAVLDLARNELAITDPDYSNLINEYRDGILLYEISNNKVWDKASKDTEGLAEYFRANKNKYAWDSPRLKSFVFFANNDSLINVAVNYADSLSTDDPVQFVQTMRKRFGRDVKVERVVAAKGENPITDYLAFGGDKDAADKKCKWPAYKAYKPRMLDQPEEAADVRGAAVTDYQSMLEQQWLGELHKKYKVKVNGKEFKKLQKKYTDNAQ